MHADEVLMCAGAVHTPAILQRSGVGQSRLMSELGIDQVADLPVGESFQDHPGIRLNLTIRRGAQLPHGGFRHIGVVGRYTSGVEGTGPADMQVVAINGGTAHDAVNETPTSGGDGFALGGVVIWLNEAFSAGRLAISSPEPGLDPTIEENMVSDPRDLARLREAADMLFQIAEQASIQAVIDPDQPAPVLALTSGVGWGGRDGLSKAEWQGMSLTEQEDYIRANCFDCQHASGTCRMGRPDDPATVVSSKNGVVHGLENLRGEYCTQAIVAAARSRGWF